MFTQFESHFHPDGPRDALPNSEASKSVGDADLAGFLSRFGGISFRNGLYRVMDHRIMLSAGAFIGAAFPIFSKTYPFASDWLGRIFALDPGRFEEGSQGVVMFEPGTSEALEMPCNLVTFHECELINYGDAALAISFYEQWLASGGAVPTHNQCAGYKRPLFLGGEDEVENLDISDLDVYWTLNGQLIQKIRNPSPGSADENFAS